MLATGLIGVLVSLGVAGLVLASAMIASHQARASADLAALAGATEVMRGGSTAAGCAAAAQVVRMNAGRLAACSSSGSSVEVVVEVRPSLSSLGASSLGPAVARARAGPPNSR